MTSRVHRAALAAVQPEPDRMDAVATALTAAEGLSDGDGRLERLETHASVVLVGDSHALKVKRPVKLAFLDYSTLARRRAMCREEIRLNRRLAPDVYLGTVGIAAGPDGAARLEPEDDAQGVTEVGVLMRRYAERDTLARAIADGSATEAQARAVGARLAAFHRSAARPDRPEAAVASLRQAVRTTLDDLEAALPDDQASVRALRGCLEAGLSARREELVERGRRGLVVDGHGDLRAEHVLLTEPLQIVDALEFDASLRIADTACDLAFLLMDLEGEGADALAAAVVAGYRQAGGDAGDDALLALMGAYRALVRAKVDLLAGRPARARARLAHATALGWRARGPLVLAVGGPPATSKSTLARAVCRSSGMVHVSSDVVRKASVGLAPRQRAPRAAYSRATTLATYRALGEHAAAALAMGRGAVIDATLSDLTARAALREGLGPAADWVLYVECHAPPDVVRRRARARDAAGGDPSDATADIAALLDARFAPLDEIPPERHVRLRTDRDIDDVVLDMTAWLDLRWR